jgi:hypothetical protein
VLRDCGNGLSCIILKEGLQGPPQESAIVTTILPQFVGVQNRRAFKQEANNNQTIKGVRHAPDWYCLFAKTKSLCTVRQADRDAGVG